MRSNIKLDTAQRSLGLFTSLLPRITPTIGASNTRAALAQLTLSGDVSLSVARNGLYIDGANATPVLNSAATALRLYRAGVTHIELPKGISQDQIGNTFFELSTASLPKLEREFAQAGVGLEVLGSQVRMPFTWGEYYQDKNPYVPPNINRYAGLGCTSSAATILGIALMCSETVRNDQETLTPIILALATGLVSLPILGMIANSAIKKTIWHLMSIYPISPSAVRNSYDELTRDWENYAVGKLSETETAEMIFGLPKTNPTKITWQQCIVGERYKGEGYIHHPDYSTEKGPIYESIMGYRTEAESRYAKEDFQRAGTIINMAPLNTRADILLALEHLDFYLASGARPHVRLSEG